MLEILLYKDQNMYQNCDEMHFDRDDAFIFRGLRR